MATFWDELKDMFKTKSQREEERQQKMKDALAAENDVVEQLKKLEQEYEASKPQRPKPDIDALFPEDPGLKEIDYAPATDEELKERASAETDYKKQIDLNKTEGRFDNALAELFEGRDDAKETLKDKFDKLDELYKSLREKTENESLKRGVARSSIALNKLENVDAERAGSEEEAKRAYIETMDAIDAEEDRLKREKETALSELDLKYATELDEKLFKLKKERDWATLKFEKYNNEIREKQREYALKREEDISEYLKNREKERQAEESMTRTYESTFGYSGEKLENYNKRYSIAYDFYMSLSPDIAASALEASPNMRYYLGNNYGKLQKALKERQDGAKKYY